MKTVIKFKKIVHHFSTESSYTPITHPLKNQVCKVSLTASFLESKVRQKIICSQNALKIRKNTKVTSKKSA
jgi:hypothetical protein